ncbi:MAG: ABC transporter substrate-binding protein, partial [Thaumarchaeota archaeon]|nr:ABC transporter substrate-binding protein [Nitrososphaerota archaeon]
MATSTKAIAFLVVGLVIGAAAGAAAVYALIPQSSNQSTTKVYTIGLAYELSGNLATFGQGMRDAANLAFNQLNAIAGPGVQFKTVAVDTQSTPQGALQAVQTLVQTDKVSILLGPIASASEIATEQYVNTNHVLEVACCSSSILLAQGKNGYIIDTSATDLFTSEVTQAVLTSENYKHVAVIYQNDAQGGPLFQYINQTFTAAGMQVAGVPFDPTQTDFGAQVSALSADVANFGTSQTAVVVITSSAPAQTNIYGHASSDATLSKVNWFAPGGATVSPVLLPPQASASLTNWLMSVNYTAMSASSASNPMTTYFNQTFTDTYGHQPQGTFALAYDSAMIVGLSILAAGNDNSTTILKTIPNIARSYVGGSGPKGMDSNNVVMVATFAVSKIHEVGSTYS